ncbi:MAG: hypothetical protein WC325_03425 [Candidatus Bathyarchaeia archaeon]|jgi:hypothetical protein
MPKKANITISLLPAASNTTVNEIQTRIKNESTIPMCQKIEHVTVENHEESYMDLKKHGISNNVARNLMELYTNK